MSYRSTDLPYLRRNEPELLKKLMREALKKAQGEPDEAKNYLLDGVSYKTWYQYVGYMGLLGEFQEYRRDVRDKRKGKTPRAYRYTDSAPKPKPRPVVVTAPPPSKPKKDDKNTARTLKKAAKEAEERLASFLGIDDPEPTPT